jgi:predicted RNA-binding protein with PUA-like domain
MAYWLLKEEPDHYSYADLERDGPTLWDGVTNNLARQNLRKVRKGDRAFYYHTGKEKAIVGEVLIVAGPQPDPGSEDPKAVVVEVRAVRRLRHTVSLGRIRSDQALADWELVRLPRLSVVPVTAAQWSRVQQLARNDD